MAKTFTGGGGPGALAAATEEYERLGRLWEALSGLDGARSPRPLELVVGPPPVIRMERVAGRPLLEVLRSVPLGGPAVRGPARRSVEKPAQERAQERAGEPAGEPAGRIAMLGAEGLLRYVAASGEPYRDFQFDNMLYDEGTGTLAFVDLGAPPGRARAACGPEQAQAVASALEISLGNLVGSTIFQSARPRWLLRRRQHRQAVALCAGVVGRAAAARPAEVSPAGLQASATSAYRRSAFGGSWPKRLWYATAGRGVARRVPVLGLTVGPVARRSRH